MLGAVDQNWIGLDATVVESASTPALYAVGPMYLTVDVLDGDVLDGDMIDVDELDDNVLDGEIIGGD